MQVHYNLLNGSTPDRSRALVTVAPSSAGLTPMQTMLLPAPVELACGRGERGYFSAHRGPVRACASTAPRRLSSQQGSRPCRGNASTPQASSMSTCDRRLTGPATIHIAAGHMHLLGASIRLELNPGTPRAQILLDIPRWDFHWQNAYTLRTAVHAKAGDIVRVTCRHDVGKRKEPGQATPGRRATSSGARHDRRDVPRDPAGHARVDSCGSSSSRRCAPGPDDPDLGIFVANLERELVAQARLRARRRGPQARRPSAAPRSGA